MSGKTVILNKVVGVNVSVEAVLAVVFAWVYLPLAL